MSYCAVGGAEWMECTDIISIITIMSIAPEMIIITTAMSSPETIVVL